MVSGRSIYLLPPPRLLSRSRHVGIVVEFEHGVDSSHTIGPWPPDNKDWLSTTLPYFDPRKLAVGTEEMNKTIEGKGVRASQRDSCKESSRKKQFA